MGDNNNRYILKLSTKIIASYLSNNKCEPEKIVSMIDEIYTGLKSIDALGTDQLLAKVPAVPIEDSIKADEIICLEDGKAFKMLKRHLASNYEMTPEQYRLKWNLPANYPMVAPSYSEKRRQLAKKAGFGTNN